MATTCKLIAKSVVGSGGTATITLDNIPGTYTDLVLLMSGRASGNSGLFLIRFNNDSGSNYSNRIVYGNGGSAGSQSNSGAASINVGISNAGAINWSATTASTFSNFTMYVPNYSGSTNKSVSCEVAVENNSSTGYNVAHAGLWSDTSAITRIDLLGNGAETFSQHTSAYLYGITKS
jgi:hypothetical protein